MLDTALQIHYDAFEDCERVVIDYQGMRSAIGFETDEELCIYLVGCGYPEYVNTEVCSEVRRHRMADQMDFEEARCRALEEYVPRRCTDAFSTASSAAATSWGSSSAWRWWRLGWWCGSFWTLGGIGRDSDLANR
jgi:hypothetical protein